MPTWNAITLTDSNSPHMEMMTNFHNYILMILFTIIILILYLMLAALKNKIINKSLLEGQELETIWTSIPAVLLILIAFPSLQILYLMEEIPSPLLTLKVMGHQWYWSYQYSDFKDLTFDSFIDYNEHNFRLLNVDNRIILPSLSPTRLLITSNDVIHSWTLPSMSVKADATPGRLNQVTIFPFRPGLFLGQCSEICGAKHSFMPIALEIIPIKSFINWLTS